MANCECHNQRVYPMDSPPKKFQGVSCNAKICQVSRLRPRVPCFASAFVAPTARARPHASGGFSDTPPPCRSTEDWNPGKNDPLRLLSDTSAATQALAQTCGVDLEQPPASQDVKNMKNHMSLKQRNIYRGIILSHLQTFCKKNVSHVLCFDISRNRKRPKLYWTSLSD